MGEGKAVDVVLLYFSKALHIVPHSILLDKLSRDEQVHSALGEELAEGHGSKGRSEWGHIWLVTHHQRCSSGLKSRASSVQRVYQ